MNGRFQIHGGKTGFCQNRLMQTGSTGALIGWESGQTTYFPLWAWMEETWLWTQFMLYRLWTLSVKRDPAHSRKKSASSKNQNYFMTDAANSIRIAIDALIHLQAEQPHYIYNTITTPVPPTKHAGPGKRPPRLHCLQQDWPRQRVLPCRYQSLPPKSPPFGLFEYLFMGLGLTNADQTVKRTVDKNVES